MTEPTIDEMIEWLESTDSFQERSQEKRKAIRAILESHKEIVTSDNSGKALLRQQELQNQADIERVNARIRNERTND